MTLPGLPGSPRPRGDDWIPRELRDLRQTVEQLRGQLSRTQLALNAVVVDVTVAGSTLTVTHGDGTTHSYTLP